MISWAPDFWAPDCLLINLAAIITGLVELRPAAAADRDPLQQRLAFADSAAGSCARAGVPKGARVLAGDTGSRPTGCSWSSAAPLDAAGRVAGSWSDRGHDEDGRGDRECHRARGQPGHERRAEFLERALAKR